MSKEPELDFEAVADKLAQENEQLSKQLADLKQEAETRIQIVNERLTAKENELQDVFYDRHLTRVQLDKAHREIANLTTRLQQAEQIAFEQKQYPALVEVPDSDEGESVDSEASDSASQQD